MKLIQLIGRVTEGRGGGKRVNIQDKYRRCGAVNGSSPAGKRQKSTILKQDKRGLLEYTIDCLWLREEQEAERERARGTENR